MGWSSKLPAWLGLALLGCGRQSGMASDPDGGQRHVGSAAATAEPPADASAEPQRASDEPAPTARAEPEPECVDAAVADLEPLVERDRSALAEGAVAALHRELAADVAASDESSATPEQRAALQESEREARALRAKVPATLRGDFDGDGKFDTATSVLAPDRQHVGIAVEFARGITSLIGAGRPTRVRYGGSAGPSTGEDDQDVPRSDWAELDRCDADLSFLVGWTLLERGDRPGTLSWRRTGNRVHTFAPQGVQGDALLVSGGDAYNIYYYDGTDWRWVHPGV